MERCGWCWCVPHRHIYMNSSFLIPFLQIEPDTLTFLMGDSPLEMHNEQCTWILGCIIKKKRRAHTLARRLNKKKLYMTKLCSHLLYFDIISIRLICSRKKYDRRWAWPVVKIPEIPKFINICLTTNDQTERKMY